MMNRQDVMAALGAVRDSSKQRKFVQSIELAINFRGIDFKKAENRIDITVNFPHSTGKSSAKVALFARDRNFIATVKGMVARVITEQEISGFDKKAAGKLADEFDAFLAEGPVMLEVGRHLGQVLAPKGKMPKPILPESSALEQALKTISSGVRVSNKKGKYMPVVHTVVGKEDMDNEKLADNIMAVCSAVSSKVGEQAIKNIYVKLTMSPAVMIGGNQGGGAE